MVLQKIMASVRQQGVTLIEVLIAMLLLSLAVSSTALMQGKSIDATQESVWRNQAALIAQDILARIELNSRGHCAEAFACAVPNGLAQQDWDELVVYAASTLPNGQLMLGNCGSSDVRCIKISWGKTQLDGCLPASVLTASDFVRESDLAQNQCLIFEH